MFSGSLVNHTNPTHAPSGPCTPGLCVMPWGNGWGPTWMTGAISVCQGRWSRGTKSQWYPALLGMGCVLRKMPRNRAGVRNPGSSLAVRPRASLIHVGCSSQNQIFPPVFADRVELRPPLVSLFLIPTSQFHLLDFTSLEPIACPPLTVTSSL